MMKADHSAAQSIVCCIGTSVAGQPTQFLFERAVESLRIDWQAISVEVPPDSFKTACDGMRAMRFKGIRFFDKLQAQAIEDLAGSDPSATFVGQLTSGALTKEHWVFWDHVGYAWLDLLQRFQTNRLPIVWLHGNSRTTRSTFVAIMSLPGNAPRWLWTDPAEFDAESPWKKHVESWIAEGTIQPQPDVANITNLFTRWLHDSEKKRPNKKEQTTSNSALASKASVTATGPMAPPPSTGTASALVAFISEDDQIPLELPQPIGELAFELLMSASAKQPLSFSDNSIQRIQPSELLVAGEIYDFHRWTDRKVPPELMQDAFDEYSDF